MGVFQLGVVPKVMGYLGDPAVALWRKCLGLFAVAYVVLPFDLIPDFIPILGWLDDIGVVGLVVWFLVRDIRRHAAAAGARPASGAPP